MSHRTVISAENLGKSYRISHQARRSRDIALRDVIADKFRGMFRSGSKSADRLESTEEFWALKNINFEIKQGEVVGIIGRNGAGKSTLLKILSRITEPTRGRVGIRGRVASLLEVGTGFHPELTGRENIYLNGAILGMSRAEIRKKFDEIVDFADVEKFLDTPVKRYSSGMYVRLGFAIAAHLEPEILIVDEVLAVGDAAFQQKCHGKVEKVAGEGRTVLMVSHNMSTIQQLCKRCILLRQGEIHKIGAPAEVVGAYFSESKLESDLDLRDWQDRKGSGELRLVRFTITDESGVPTSIFPMGSTMCFRLEAEVHESLVDPCFGVLLQNSSGEPVSDLQSNHAGLRVGRVQGRVKIHGTFANINLYPGKYFLSPWITDSAIQRSIDLAWMPCSIRVTPTPGKFGDLHVDSTCGTFWVPSDWKSLPDENLKAQDAVADTSS